MTSNGLYGPDRSIDASYFANWAFFFVYCRIVWRHVCFGLPHPTIRVVLYTFHCSTHLTPIPGVPPFRLFVWLDVPPTGRHRSAVHSALFFLPMSWIDKNA